MSFFIVMTLGVENEHANPASLGVFDNFFSTGASINASSGTFSGGKAFSGVGYGASTGAQACLTSSVLCKP